MYHAWKFIVFSSHTAARISFSFNPEDRCRWAKAKSMRSGEFIYYLEIFNVNKRSSAIFWFEILFPHFPRGTSAILAVSTASILFYCIVSLQTRTKLINAIMFCPLSGRAKKSRLHNFQGVAMTISTFYHQPPQLLSFLLTHLFPILCI